MRSESSCICGNLHLTINTSNSAIELVLRKEGAVSYIFNEIIVEQLFLRTNPFRNVHTIIYVLRKEIVDLPYQTL